MRYFSQDLDDAWFPKDFGALELPGSSDDLDAVLNARPSQNPLALATQIKCSPGFPGFVEWMISIAEDITNDPEESLTRRQQRIVDVMVVTFVFGYDWRQIVERRRIAERN